MKTVLPLSVLLLFLIANAICTVLPLKPSRPSPSTAHRLPLSAESDDYYPAETADFAPGSTQSIRLAESTDDTEDDESDEEAAEEDSEEPEDDPDSEESESATADSDQADDEGAQDVEKVPDKGQKAVRTSLAKKGKHSGGIDSKFRGIEAGIVEGTNVTHLSYMVFKLIKANNIKSVVDMPCRNTLDWFPELLHRLDFEVPGFQYYCVDSEQHSQDDIRKLFSDAGNVEFMHIRPEETHMIPKADLVFSWDGPQQWGVKKTWSFFTALRQIRPKYLMITNNPTVLNINEQRGTLNLRKQPFHFSQAMRVISQVHESEIPKQLLFYETTSIRRNF